MSKTKTQSDALELAEFFGSMKKSSHRWYDGVPVHEKAAAELRRLDTENKQLNVALDEWMEKTHWVQDTAQVLELGMHRADVLRARIEALDAENKALVKALEAVEMDVVEIGMGESTIGDSARYKVEDALRQVRAAQAAAKDGGAA